MAPAFVPILPGMNPECDSVSIVVMILADGTRVDFPASKRELIAHVVLALAKTHSATNAAALLQADAQ